MVYMRKCSIVIKGLYIKFNKGGGGQFRALVGRYGMFYWAFKINFMCLFIFGCVGSSLLHVGFL